MNRRDCACERVRHVHGTEPAYSRDGCRCLPCALARSRWIAAWKAGVEPERTTAPVHGTRRRLQALTVLGWSAPEIARHTGLNDQVILRLRTAPDSRTVLWQTRDAVTAAYDRLWDRHSTGPHAPRMMTLARRHGWVAPLCWDDDEIDDPAASPHIPTAPAPWDLHPCGTTAAARRHYRRGERLDVACQNAARRQKTDRKKAA